MDKDGIGDVCDNCNKTGEGGFVDSDLDGVDDACDNCPQHKNENQANDDDDETGNACDPDDDNDGQSEFKSVFNINHRAQNDIHEIILYSILAKKK